MAFDYRYLVAIIAGGIFVFLFICSLGSFIASHHRVHVCKAHLDEYFNCADLVKMEYDLVNFDLETHGKGRENAMEQLTIDDLINDRSVFSDSPFAKIDADEIEEIVGTYVP